MNIAIRCLWFAGLVWGLPWCGGQACDGAEPATPRTPKVLILGIDGVRPDALQQAATPHLDRLRREGAYAEGTDILPERPVTNDTVSGPNWSSILTGVWSDKHAVLDNNFRTKNYEQYPHFFVRLKSVRPEAHTVSVSSWQPIHTHIVAGADVGEHHGAPGGKDYDGADQLVSARAVELLRTTNPTAMFVYIAQVDETGHQHGFHPTVPQYVAAIERADGYVGRVLAAVEARPTYPQEDWLVIVCTDHGGRGTGHGGGRNVPEIRRTFLIFHGPSARRGMIEEPTFLVDVAATALRHTAGRIEPAWELDGRPIGLTAAD